MMKMRDHTLEPPAFVPTMRNCTICRDSVPYECMSQFKGICEDCEWEYIKCKAAELAQDFIEEQEGSFYHDWWFNGLSKEERIEVTKSAYIKQRMLAKCTGELPYMAEDEAAFCRQHKYFPDFVKERE